MNHIPVSRIAIWASFGLLVSFAWGLYFAGAEKALPVPPIVYILASLTQPVVAAALYLKLVPGLGLTLAASANAVTYALLGLILQTVLRRGTTDAR